MTMFLKVEHKNSKADINFETLIFKHTLIYIYIYIYIYIRVFLTYMWYFQLKDFLSAWANYHANTCINSICEIMAW